MDELMDKFMSSIGMPPFPYKYNKFLAWIITIHLLFTLALVLFQELQAVGYALIITIGGTIFYGMTTTIGADIERLQQDSHKIRYLGYGALTFLIISCNLISYINYINLRETASENPLFSIIYLVYTAGCPVLSLMFVTKIAKITLAVNTTVIAYFCYILIGIISLIF